MSGAAIPPVIPEPFGNDADPAFITNPIPDTTATSGRASYNLGFPPITMQPVAGGGIPPFGQDFNGLLFALSSHDFYVQSGQLFLWSADVATAVGGYGIGTLLGSADRETVWYNTVDANSTDPDATDGSAAGWVSLYSVGFQAFTGLTTGTVTLNPTQAARKVIALSGALTGNVTVVMPNWAAPSGRWLIQNNTTGAPTVTVKTAGGTGVVIPQGGPSNPVEVYGDGTNIYPTVPAASLIPADQSPTPLTLAERTNNGDLIAVHLISTAGQEPGTTIKAVFCEDTVTPNFLRKVPLANFEAQISLSTLAGQVTAAQVPLAAVLQYAANVLANAALTGTPTAPTAALGTSTTQVATTAFANPGASLTGGGPFWERRASGALEAWGVAAYSGAGTPFVVNLPVAFAVVEMFGGHSTIGGNMPGSLSSTTNTISFDMNGLGGTAQNISWRAIGR